MTLVPEKRVWRKHFPRLKKQKFMEHGGLLDSSQMEAGEKLMIYLTIVGGSTLTHAANIWERGYATVSRLVNEVSNAILRCRHILYIPFERAMPSKTTHSDYRYLRYFSNCIGAFDGSHCSAVCSLVEWRNRKGAVTQNVFAACNFDLSFSYALCGWEGAANDGRVV